MTEYSYFLSSLFDDGQIFVPQISPLHDEDISAANNLLTDYEQQYRMEMPAGIPQFSVDIGQWAACSFYRACQFALLRDESAESIAKELGKEENFPDTPETHYSVDIVFRFLPDLFQYCTAFSADDPLGKYLYQWAVRWPLSSVGIKDLQEPVKIDGFAESPGLLRLYADRVIKSEDISRIEDERIKSLVEASWGMYPELVAKFSKSLQEHSLTKAENNE